MESSEVSESSASEEASESKIGVGSDSGIDVEIRVGDRGGV